MQIGSLSGGGTSAQLFQFGAQIMRSTDLEVVTAEGDRVTISTDSARMLGYASLAGQSGDTSVTASAMQVSGSDSTSISVEGDLSKAELRDLQKVIKAFQQAATRGDATRLLDRLSRSDMDTIASVSGSASTEVVVTATSTEASTSSSESAEETVAPPPLPPPPPPPRNHEDGERSVGQAAGFVPTSVLLDNLAALLKGETGSERQPVGTRQHGVHHDQVSALTSLTETEA